MLLDMEFTREMPMFNAKFDPRKGGDDQCADPGKPDGASGAASSA